MASLGAFTRSTSLVYSRLSLSLQTVGPQQFVDTLLSSYRSNNVLSRVTFQSFDWRTIIRAKEQEPSIVTVALIDASDLRPIWTAGIDVEAQEGPDLAQKVAQAAKKANADILSPSHGVGEVEVEGYVPFANKTMVDEAHKLGMKVVPYTPNSLFTGECAALRLTRCARDADCTRLQLRSCWPMASTV